MIRFYDFTNQGESKITEHLAPIQTIIIQMLLCLRWWHQIQNTDRKHRSTGRRDNSFPKEYV